jgi:hypothetical protein
MSPRTNSHRGSPSNSETLSRFPAYVSLSRVNNRVVRVLLQKKADKVGAITPAPPVTKTLEITFSAPFFLGKALKIA